MKIFDIHVSNFTKKDLLEKILSLYKREGKFIVSNVNIHALNIAYKDRVFKKILQDSAIVFVDGYGVKFLSRIILGYKGINPLTPPIWMHDLYAKLPKGTRIFLLGDEQIIIQRYFNMVTQNFSDLNFVGFSNGFVKNNNLLIQDINNLQPEIMIVGMGMPLQEKWIYNNLKRMDCKIFIPVGAYFRWKIGIQRRPPSLVSSIGLEWLYRFILEPRRLFRRYIIGNPLFLFRLIKYRLNR